MSLPYLFIGLISRTSIVSTNIRYMRGGFLGNGASNNSGVVDDDIVLPISVATSSETLERRPALYAVCRQRPTKKLCCGRETTRFHCKIRYVWAYSKFIAASRGSPCDSTAFLSVSLTEYRRRSVRRRLPDVGVYGSL